MQIDTAQSFAFDGIDGEVLPYILKIKESREKFGLTMYLFLIVGYGREKQDFNKYFLVFYLLIFFHYFMSP